MALPMNDDFANRELSIDELGAIAAGISFWGKLWRDLSSEFAVFGGPAGQAAAGAAGAAASGLRRLF